MLRTFIFYLYFFPVTLIFSFIALFISLFSQNKTHSFVRFWGRSCLIFAGLKIQTRGTENIVLDSPAIYVSNHQSNFDIPIIYAGLPVQFRWMAKQELFRVPFFGLAMKRSGIIAIDRSNRRTTIHSISAAARRIKEGTSVVIFPEGTRTPDGQLQEFKKGALLLATKAQVPVVPIAIHGSYQIQPKDRWLVKGGPLHIEVLPPISTTGLKSSDLDALTQKVRQQIAQSLEGAKTNG
ncbi:1-acyl-sn-glycerol-3-phosphate acyltransferase [Desulfuromusa kysingii]|uniref:1-acyl-sn-glycerol-3-phosphate acyltransferase n=1 Tax=Desulfuromusa kysingii TaxID=37625 RepID=A0A1H3VYM4_9BACT|nr:lysophospholipid acyltransferase family protein [Desulfuromusa kysingii]SDZ79850.1 1-acyl-sn-glycerol-3-phosphate acyltransferase [Desulfuromusa kysingii]